MRSDLHALKMLGSTPCTPDNVTVMEMQNVARQYGVQAMPTFLLMKNGKVVDKVVGAKKDELRNKIEQHSNKSKPYRYAI